MADELDRSEKATPKHRGEARNRGQVARSQEISSEISIVASLCALAWLGPALGHQLVGFTHQTLSKVRFGNVEIAELGPAIFTSSQPIFESVGLWIFLLFAATMVAGFSQVGFQFSSEVIGIKWERLDPIAGFKRLFSWPSAVRAIASLLKLGIIIFACRGMIEKVMSADALNRATTPLELVSFLLESSLSLGWRVALALGVVAAADYGYQRFSHEKGLRMTKEQVKEEGKQSEQNPLIRGKIRGMMRQRHRERSVAIQSAKLGPYRVTLDCHGARRLAMTQERA